MVYIAEYAKSGRAGCRGCKQSIGKGELRLATLVQSKRHSGMDAHWFHVPCFFVKHKKQAIPLEEIAKLAELTVEDQQLIKKYIAGDVVTPKLDAQKTISVQDAGLRKLDEIKNSGEFFVGYAKSSKSHCLSCDGRIVKGEVRISQKDYTSETALHIPTKCLDRWHHVHCFAFNRQNLEFYNSANSIPGISSLKPEDQEMLLQKLPRIDGPNPENEGTKEKTSSNETTEQRGNNFEDNRNADNAHDFALQGQENILESFKEKLNAHLNDPEQLLLVLRHNDQDIPIGTDKMVERIADIMAFGKLERCSKCKGQFVYRPGSGYHCIGYLTQLIKCTEHTMEPKRLPFLIPDELLSTAPFNEYEYVPRTRIIRAVKRKDDEYQSPEKLPKLDQLPLLKMKFMISDDAITPEKAQQIKSKLEEFGGTVVNRLSKHLAGIFSTHADVQAMTRKIQYAQQYGIPVISPDFVNSLTKFGFEFEVTAKKHLLGSWVCFDLSRTSDQTTCEQNPKPLHCLSSTMNCV